MARAKKKDWEIAHIRRHILKSAAAVFARKGFAGATMREIADEAEFSPASLYTYFKGKDALLDGLRASMAEELVAPFELKLPEGLSFRQSLELFLGAQAVWVEDNRDAFRFFTRHGQQDGAEGVQQRYLRALEEWIDQHATPEELGGHSPRVAAVLFNGIGSALFQEWIRAEEPGPLHDVVLTTVAVYLGGLAGPPPETTS